MSYFPTDIPFMSEEELIENGLKKPYKKPEIIEKADVVPVVHGKWINGRCNKCGEHAPFWAMASTYYTSNFCPNCGAKMDREE